MKDLRILKTKVINMNDFTEQTNLILSELTTITENYNPKEVPKQTFEDIVKWLNMVAEAQIERLRGIIDSTKK